MYLLIVRVACTVNVIRNAACQDINITVFLYNTLMPTVLKI